MDKAAKTYAMNLAEMITERDRLNAAIETEQTRLRADWNSRLDDLQRDLLNMLKLHAIPYTTSERKNVSTVTVTDRDLVIEFPYQYDRWSAEHVYIRRTNSRVYVEIDPVNITDEEFLGVVGVLIGTL